MQLNGQCVSLVIRRLHVVYICNLAHYVNPYSSMVSVSLVIRLQLLPSQYLNYSNNFKCFWSKLKYNYSIKYITQPENEHRENPRFGLQIRRQSLTVIFRLYSKDIIRLNFILPEICTYPKLRLYLKRLISVEAELHARKNSRQTFFHSKPTIEFNIEKS